MKGSRFAAVTGERGRTGAMDAVDPVFQLDLARSLKIYKVNVFNIIVTLEKKAHSQCTNDKVSLN